MSAIKNGAPALQLSPLIVLCGITHVRIVLPDMLDYTLCHYRVWRSVSSMKISSRVGVRKYLTEYYFLRVHAFYHVLLAAFMLYALISFDTSLAKGGC